jgi:hypothetical protein
MKITKVLIEANPETFQPMCRFEGVLDFAITPEQTKLTEDELYLEFGKEFAKQLQEALNTK